MKKLIKLSVLSLVVALILALSVVSAFAVDTATVNGKPAEVGSNVTYTLSISDAHQNVVGIDARFFFDQEVLELVEVNTDNLGDSTVVNDNMNKDGVISMNNAYIGGGKGLECKEKVALTTITFKVLKAAETQITYYIPYIYDFDMVNIYDYTFTYDLAVDQVAVITDETPVLAGDTELGKINDKGDFDNNVEGTGSGVKPTAAPNAPAPGGDSDTGEDSGEPLSKGVVFAIVAVVIIVVAVVVLIVVKITMDKKNGGASEEE